MCAGKSLIVGEVSNPHAQQVNSTSHIQYMYICIHILCLGIAERERGRERERRRGERGRGMAIFPGCSLCTPCVLSKVTSLAEVIAQCLYMIIHVLYMYIVSGYSVHVVMYNCVHV